MRAVPDVADVRPDVVAAAVEFVTLDADPLEDFDARRRRRLQAESCPVSFGNLATIGGNSPAEDFDREVLDLLVRAFEQPDPVIDINRRCRNRAAFHRFQGGDC